MTIKLSGEIFPFEANRDPYNPPVDENAKATTGWEGIPIELVPEDIIEEAKNRQQKDRESHE